MKKSALNRLNGAPVRGKVVFCAFTGIAPRQYRRLFSMSERGAKRGGSLAKWETNRRSLLPVSVNRNASILYVAEERNALNNLPSDVYPWNKSELCPSNELAT